MDFEEVYTSPFTTPTTCYSCGRKQKRNVDSSNGESTFTVQFATENHILGVRAPGNASETNRNEVETSCRFLPRDAAQLTCVGYTNWEEEEVVHANRDAAVVPANIGDGSSSLTIIRHIEALALIDPELIEDHESSSSAVVLHRPSPVIIEKDDSASAVTPIADGRSQSKQNHRHQREPSSTSMSTMMSGTTGSSTNPPLSSGSNSYHRKSQSELSKGSHTTISDTQPSYQTSNNNANTEKKQSGKKMLSQTSKARLVLRQDHFTVDRSTNVVSTESEDVNDQIEDRSRDQLPLRQTHKSSFAMLDFRPLCPCVARWGKDPRSSDSSHENNDNGFVGIWLGSADDATLRFYVPSTDDNRSLVSIPLPEEHFSVDSPVMALDFCSVSWPRHGAEDPRSNHQAASSIETTTHTLAVGCQDGTIQLITWKDPDARDNGNGGDGNKYRLFGDISSQKVIVDGPLVCLKLDYNRFASLRIIVGSLCGYVCQLNFDHNQRNSCDSLWEGPYMVVQDLFNSSINIEESVLTVDVWQNYVVVGTQLGRCLLFATQDSENYFLVWQVVLPYSVHSITIINREDVNVDHASIQGQKEGDCSAILSLAVTTRRSFHIFGASRGGIVWRRKPQRERYSPELARARLLKILQKIRKENQASDSTTRKCVLETIEELLKKVEEMSQKNGDKVASDTLEDKEGTTDIVSCAINTLIDRVEERVATGGKVSPSSTDIYNLAVEQKQVARPHIDTPHWEYSSSDEEVSLQFHDAKEHEDEVQNLSTGPKFQDAVDEHT